MYSREICPGGWTYIFWETTLGGGFWHCQTPFRLGSGFWHFHGQDVGFWAFGCFFEKSCFGKFMEAQLLIVMNQTNTSNAFTLTIGRYYVFGKTLDSTTYFHRNLCFLQETNFVVSPYKTFAPE
jgi:hypothetical protein